jgi:hypothetical protein
MATSQPKHRCASLKRHLNQTDLKLSFIVRIIVPQINIY